MLLSTACTSALNIRPTLRRAEYLPRHPSPVAQYSGETTRGTEALTETQRKAFLAATEDDQFSMSELISADAAMWDSVRSAYPALVDLSDAELSATLESYVNTPPSVTDVLFKTPVGPVFLINIILAVTGLSWCDAPFVDSSSTACVQVAARKAAQQ